MRLTEKIKEIRDNFNAEYAKLADLEDVEDELGIDLKVLFKALKNGIWSKGGYYSDVLEKEPHFVERPEIGLCSYYDEVDENYNTILSDRDVMCIYTYDYEIMVRQTRLKDYGKTWALTREDLL